MLEQVPLSRLGLLARVRARNMVMMVGVVVMVVMVVRVVIMIRGGGGDVYILRNRSTRAKICRRRLTMTF